MNRLKFNGISSEDLGLVIQTPPTYSYPERDVETVHVPGRNGDLIIDKNCYKNVKRSYLVGKQFLPGTDYYANMEQVLKWLQSANGGYARLEDTYDENVFRLASYKASGSFTNIYDEAATVTIEFECKPQRYLKAGEKKYKYDWEEEGIIIENMSPYEALPLIEINNLTHDVGKMTMITISDVKEDENLEEVFASVSINDINKQGDLHIFIDSDNQIAYDEEGKDISPYVGLNGTKFPILATDKTKISIKNYEKLSSGLINSYSSLIQKRTIDREYDSSPLANNEKFSYIKSEYAEYDSLLEKNQHKINIESFETIVSKKKNTYNLQSIQSLAYDTAEIYKFASINEILSALSDSWDVGLLSQGDTDYLHIVESDDHLTLTISAKVAGFFSSTNHPQWKRYDSTSIIETITRDNTSKDWDSISISHLDSNSDGTLVMDSIYSDAPKWITCRPVYSDGSATHSIDKFEFRVSKPGYVYRPAEGINILGLQLGKKAGWLYIKPAGYVWPEGENDPHPTWGDSTDDDVLLDTLTWNSQKKAFGSKRFLSTKTDQTFEYRWILDIPQYDDIKDIAELEDGSNDHTMSKIKMISKVNGYFAWTKKESESLINTWAHVLADDPIIIPTELKDTTVSGTESFTLYYIKPDNDNGTLDMKLELSDSDREIIDPEPYYKDKITGNFLPIRDESGLNRGQMFFKIRKSGKFRYTYMNKQKEGEDYSDWFTMNYEKDSESNSQFIDIPDSRYSSSQSYSICYLEYLPPDLKPVEGSTLYNNRQYLGNYKAEPRKPEGEDRHPEDYVSLPSYLNVVVDEEANKVFYSAKKSGLYKWDSMTVWKKVLSEDIITSSTLVSSDKVSKEYTEEERSYEEDAIKIAYFAVNNSSQNSYITLKEAEGYIRSVYEMPNITKITIKANGKTCNGKLYWWNKNENELANSVDVINVTDIFEKTFTGENLPGYFKFVNTSNEDSCLKEIQIDHTRFYPLFETSYKDDSLIQYMEELPEYQNDEKGEHPNWISCEPTVDNYGNPDGLKMVVSIPGYYRANYESDWKKYKEGDVLVESAFNESNTVYKLEDTDDDLSDVEVTVTPRWWML